MTRSKCTTCGDTHNDGDECGFEVIHKWRVGRLKFRCRRIDKNNHVIEVSEIKGGTEQITAHSLCPLAVANEIARLTEQRNEARQRFEDGEFEFDDDQKEHVDELED